MDTVRELLMSYKALGCNMSLKVYFLMLHMNFFPANMSRVSDEHGEGFHQDISIMKKRYKGKRPPKMLRDVCWMLKRNVPDVDYNRGSRVKHF